MSKNYSWSFKGSCINIEMWSTSHWPNAAKLVNLWVRTQIIKKTKSLILNGWSMSGNTTQISAPKPNQNNLHWLWPFIMEKKIFLIIWFMVFISISSDLRFQKGFWKICTESQDIGQNVSSFAGLIWKAYFLHFFDNILELGEYFSKPIFALKQWVQTVDLNTMNNIM